MAELKSMDDLPGFSGLDDIIINCAMTNIFYVGFK